VVSPRPDGSQRGPDGSAVVTALIVGLVAAVVLGTLASRSIGDSLVSRARMDRAQASALSEYGIAAGLIELDSGLARDLRRVAPGSSGPGAIVLPIAVPDEDGEGTEVGLEVTVGIDDATGDILLVSRAHVRREVRRIVARVRPRTTSDHLLLTDFEVVDPVLFQQPRSDCAAPRGDDLRSEHCLAVAHVEGVFDGPVHSNDALDLRQGVTVSSLLTTSALVSDGAGSVGPDLAPTSDANVIGTSPFGLHHAPGVEFPRSTTSVLEGAAVTCRFRGPTLLRLDGPIVRVTSPRSVERAGDPAIGATAIGCMGVDRQALVTATPILLPPRAIIEVVRDPLEDCVDHPLGIGIDEDDTRDWWCTDGDAFVWGSYVGSRTVLAEDRIQLVWDVVPDLAHASGAGAAGAALGLVAGDSVILRRPVGPVVRRVAPYGRNVAFAGPDLAPFGGYPDDAPTPSATTWDAPRIVASLVALRGSVGIQNPFRGEEHPGSILIEGSLAARFHGLFAWEDRTSTGALRGAMGYPLQLRYDPNLLDVAPPGMPLTAYGEVRILSLEVLDDAGT
jgi:hypothetical protein